MKPLFIAVYVLLISGTAFGQSADSTLSKWNVSVNVGYDHLFWKRDGNVATFAPESFEYTNLRSFHFNVKTGVQVSEKLSLHLGFGMKPYEVDEYYPSENSCFPTNLQFQFLDIPLEARYYFGASKFRWHATAGFSQSFGIRGIRTVQHCNSEPIQYFFNNEMAKWLPSVSIGGGGQVKLIPNLALSAEVQWVQYLKQLESNKTLKAGGISFETGLVWQLHKS